MGGDSMDKPPTSAASRRRRARVLNCTAIALNCISAGSIQLFPLVSVPLSKELGVTGAQTSILGVAGILGQYLSAVGWGALADVKGPGAVSLSAAGLFGSAYSLLGWRFKVVVAQPLEERWQHEWVLFAALFFLAGAGTTASYFSSIVSAGLSFPARHSGLAIGVPCAILGLSPLFLSPLASFFTSPVTRELDPGNWLFFLAALLAVINTFGGLFIKVLPWVDVDSDSDSDSDVDESGGVMAGNAAPGGGIASRDSTERSPLLPSPTSHTPPNQSQKLGTLLSDPSFGLFFVVLLLALGPCEMIFASLGSIVEALLGIRIAGPPDDTPLLLLDTRALEVRRLHIQILSVSNTASRLIIGAVSDWLSYSSMPPHHIPHLLPSSAPLSSRVSHYLKRTFRQPPRVSRLFFVLVACCLLTFSFANSAVSLDTPSHLWFLSVPVGTAYGILFTVAPAIARTVYPVVDFGRNFGILSLAGGAGAAIFTPLFGVLMDREAERQRSLVCYGRTCWREIFLWSTGSVVAAALVVVVLWKRWWRGKV